MKERGDVIIDECIEDNTYEYIIKGINNEGALHFSLIDPDPLRQGPNKAAKIAKYAEEAGTDAILIGGSTVFNHTCAILTLPELTVQVFPLSNNQPLKVWNWSQMEQMYEND